MRLPIAAAFLISATAALADGGVTVPLPTIPDLTRGEAEHLLRQLVVANVMQINCPGSSQTMPEWALLTGSADLVAERLGLVAGLYDQIYFRPAFDLLDKPESCDRELPRVRPLINRLIAWGGSLEPISE